MGERAEQFGDTPALQDTLAALIVAGRKRATTSLARWYGAHGSPWPVVGETWVVLDGQGKVRCRCVTSRVEIRAFGDVDAEHAAAEGEKNGSLARWQEIHRRFFSRQAVAHGFTFDDDSLVVLERFDVLEEHTASIESRRC